MIKILLIYPNFHYFPGWLENNLNYRQVPLGLAYLAACVRSKYEVDIRICDASLLGITHREVLLHVSEFKPDVIGIATYTPTINFARDVADLAKKIVPDCLIIFGGPHVTALPLENLDVADICVLGEGERTFEELIGSIIAKKDIRDIPGISFKRGNESFIAPERGIIEDLDSLPFPARDLYPKKTYNHIYPYNLKNSYYNAIVTSRGCNYHCNFCSSATIWKKGVRYRSLDNVFLEIEQLVRDYETSLLRIGDDNFTADPVRVADFCAKKKKLFPGLKWYCHSRVDALTPELVGRMKDAGCVEVQIGVESGDDRILRNCNKMTTTRAIRDTLRLLRKNKINVWATFIIGNEGETRETIEKTISFAKKIDPTYSSFMFLSPLPGTRSFENMSQKGQIKTFDWSKYNWHGEPVYEMDGLTKKDLMDLRKKAYRSFYLRPKIIFRYIWAAAVSRQWKTIFSDALLLFKFVFGLIN